MIPAHELESVAFAQCDRVVFKLDGSRQGNGVYVFDRGNFDRETIKSLGNGVIQKFITQHRVFNAFASKPVATLRLTPDSGVRFSGVKIPAFAQCVATVLDLHQRIPFARCIGWDVTVDADENVQVMEWNGEHNDVKFSEATQGPCFSDLKWERLSAAA